VKDTQRQSLLKISTKCLQERDSLRAALRDIIKYFDQSFERGGYAWTAQDVYRMEEIRRMVK
jgi:hypothetical protein